MLNVNPDLNAVDRDSSSWQSPVPKRSATRRQLESSSLLQGARELLIAHAGEEYHLRLTRNNKLILTK